ncbi:MAG: hypothetical protein ACLUFR_10640 [Megamonas funiformis]|uniref:hypothetical protein n=1 Tax=Megamonas funiformis TaxID=437897 RepID=UPI0039917242
MNYLLFLIIISLLSIVCYLNYDLKVVNPLITAFTSLVMVIIGLFSKHFYDIWKNNHDIEKKKKNIANLLIQELELCKIELNKEFFFKNTAIHSLNVDYSVVTINYSKLSILETYLKDINIFEDNLICNLTKFYNQYNSYINIRFKYIYILEQYLSILNYVPDIRYSEYVTQLNMLCDIANINITQLEKLYSLIIQDLQIIQRDD